MFEFFIPLVNSDSTHYTFEITLNTLSMQSISYPLFSNPLSSNPFVLFSQPCCSLLHRMNGEDAKDGEEANEVESKEEETYR